MTTTRFDSWPCKKCGYVCDAAADPLFDPDHRLPQEGDFSLCFNCCELYLLHGGRWTLATQAERDSMPENLKSQLARISAARRWLFKQDFGLEQALGENK